MSHDEDRDHFVRLVEALRPFLNQLVFVGGWAHRLHRFRSDASVPAHAPLFTEDPDVAIPAGAIPTESLRDRLVAQGFTEEFLGEDQPPVTHYRLGGESAFYAEFLTPLVGGRGRPGKTPQDTKEIGGVVAQKLRYLDVLLMEPWQVRAGKRVVNVPNAVCYVAQKLLILPRRKMSDRAKDILYIHDMIELFGASLEDLQ